MKKTFFFIFTIGCSLIWSPIFSQENETPDSLGLPGDNLNLYGVLDLFQKSETLEEFEKKLNSEDSKINNLDLNGNNKIDYISVKDHMKGNAHAIVLQVAVNEKESQDIAVIEVEKDKDDNVQVQIIGDELLYGKNYIIEPKGASSKELTKRGTPNPGYNGGGKTTNITNNYYNSNNAPVYEGYAYYPVRSWNIINYLFFPSYIAYVSPWSWGYYPGYWNPWTPLFWHSYYSFNCYHRPYFYGNFCRSGFYRNNYAHNYYGQRRSTSATVNQRNDRGAYSNTYSRRDLVSKEGRSPKTNRISNSTYQHTRINRETSQNHVANRERNPSSGNREISRSTFQNTRVNSATAEARNSGKERNPSSGNREADRSNYQNNRTNSRYSQNSYADERTASARNNNRQNRVAENYNNSGRKNNSVRQNGNSSTRSGSYSAPGSRSYSAPSHSSGGGGRSFGGGGGGGGGGGRSSGGGGFSGGGGGRGR